MFGYGALDQKSVYLKVLHSNLLFANWFNKGLFLLKDGSSDDREVLDSEDAAVANQKRMNADPLEVMLMNMGYRIPGVLDGEEIDTETRANVVQCRPS